jgi:N6-L-threonylcarbamoyladenine synthase
MVGVVTAKTLALVFNKPLIGVNHLEGHLLAPLLRDESYGPPDGFSYPYIGLAISGGHTSLYQIDDFSVYRVLGQTIDDAAGEAFDKFAKLLGLGYPGGVQVDRWAQKGDPHRFSFPRAMIHEETYDMSFSGLKTAGQRQLEKMSSGEIENAKGDLCASYQEAIVEVLIQRLDRAVHMIGLRKAILTGGVSANSRLRAVATQWAEKKGIQLVIPPLRYCTDNAAMIGYAGILRLNRGEQSAHDLGPHPKALPGDFILESRK